MSIIYLDSFQAYNGINTNSYSLQNEFYVQEPGNLSFGTGRFSGSRCVTFNYSSGNNFISRVMASTNTASIGMSIYVNAGIGGSYPRSLAAFYDSTNATPLVRLEAVGGGALQLTTAVGTVAAGYGLYPGNWAYVELIYTGGTSGSTSLYINGALICTQSGNMTTTQVGNAIIGSKYAGGNSEAGSVSFSDLYIANDAASRGDRRVQIQVPAANSSVTWTPLSGSNYANVNELPVDGDTSYVTSSTAGNQDLYTVGALPGAATSISAVQIRTCMKKTDASAHLAASVISSAGTVSVGASQSLSSNYSFGTDIYLTDPHTSAAWTSSAVNALLIGQKLVS